MQLYGCYHYKLILSGEMFKLNQMVDWSTKKSHGHYQNDYIGYILVGFCVFSWNQNHQQQKIIIKKN